MLQRLQKTLAKAGIASRRKAEELIKQGRITVNNQVVIEMGTKVDPERDLISFDGQPVSLEDKIYLLLHKPVGYLCTLNDPQKRPIISDLIPKVTKRVFPVGRLDFDSEGALIITNDGELSQLLQHPKYEVNKTYQATVTGKPDNRNLQRLRKGIMIDGQKTYPAQVRVLQRRPDTTTLEVIIHEGKKRQVRKMFAAIGCPVQRLVRTAYGNLRLGDLPAGKYRKLTQKDIKKLFSGKIPFTISKITA